MLNKGFPQRSLYFFVQIPYFNLMELSFEIPKGINDKFSSFILDNNLTEEQAKEISLMIGMAYSSGKINGNREGTILSKSIGHGR